jgi:hypothetical protein
MAKNEGPDESLELSVWTWFKLRIPAIIIVALFGDAARGKRKLRALSDSATHKALAGDALTEDEQLVHDLDMATARKQHRRLLENGARAAQIIAQEPKLLPGHLEGQPTPEPQVPKEAWSDRYREGAKLHAEPDVREMWARILAGEVTKPGSFSFKTLSVLKDVDTDSAQKFSSLLRFALDKQGLPAANEFQQHYDALGVAYVDLLRLAELGLIAFPAVSAINEIASPLVLEGGGGYVFAVHERHKPVNMHTLTRAGQELASVTDSKTTQVAVVALGEWLTTKCARLQVGFPIDPEHVFARDWSPDVITVDEVTGKARFTQP